MLWCLHMETKLSEIPAHSDVYEYHKIGETSSKYQWQCQRCTNVMVKICNFWQTLMSITTITCMHQVNVWVQRTICKHCTKKTQTLVSSVENVYHNLMCNPPKNTTDENVWTFQTSLCVIPGHDQSSSNNNNRNKEIKGRGQRIRKKREKI